jgi:hypothetical protein
LTGARVGAGFKNLRTWFAVRINVELKVTDVEAVLQVVATREDQARIK